MPRLIWSPRALADVSRLYRFLHPKDAAAAQRAARAIRTGVKILEQHPDAGRPAKGLDPPFREWPIEFGTHGYVALYRHDPNQVIILAVRHFREAGF